MSYYRHVREEIVPHLPPGPLRVLEVGCGEGATLARIRELRPDSWVAGVEVVSLESPLYDRLDHFERIDIERALPAIPRESIDVLLCLDVLEHLREPLASLRSLATLLRPGGRLIASLPNLQYVKVSVPLLFGRFEYRDDGVLDRTHLRFFTRRSAIRLIEQAGFDVERVERLRIRDVRRLMSLLLPLPGWRDLWTKQFLFVARRS
ncbi:MAG TPA: class I SAM-dependent methyltransferase [Burkholderiaceae bacterium]|nr:class I SAM-dependent methyltransferase [Burkholderiaceae bacterium]